MSKADNMVPFNIQLVKVHHFNRTVLGIEPRRLCMQSEDEHKLSMTQLREEIQEIEEAYEHGDMIGVIDGLIDLEYFLYGVFYKHGINEETHAKLFDAVHNANMLKRAGIKDTRQGFGEAIDAVKPAGWTDPHIMLARILESTTSGAPA